MDVLRDGQISIPSSLKFGSKKCFRQKTGPISFFEKGPLNLPERKVGGKTGKKCSVCELGERDKHAGKELGELPNQKVCGSSSVKIMLNWRKASKTFRGTKIAPKVHGSDGLYHR